CDPGKSAECETVFSADDPMFSGHFPDNPLVPGVILTEALAQTAGIVGASGYPEESRPRFLLPAIRQMKFFQLVRPNEQIILRTPIRRPSRLQVSATFIILRSDSKTLL